MKDCRHYNFLFQIFRSTSLSRDWAWDPSILAPQTPPLYPRSVHIPVGSNMKCEDFFTYLIWQKFQLLGNVKEGVILAQVILRVAFLADIWSVLPCEQVFYWLRKYIINELPAIVTANHFFKPDCVDISYCWHITAWNTTSKQLNDWSRANVSCQTHKETSFWADLLPACLSFGYKDNLRQQHILTHHHHQEVRSIPKQAAHYHLSWVQGIMFHPALGSSHPYVFFN
jgi:hypothetical protein